MKVEKFDSSENLRKLREGMEKIMQFLTSPNSKYKYFKTDKEVEPKSGKVIHDVEGYSSGLVTIYVDSANLEVTIVGVSKGGPVSLAASNAAMVANPDFFFAFVKEKQTLYEKLSVGAPKPNHK